MFNECHYANDIDNYSYELVQVDFKDDMATYLSRKYSLSFDLVFKLVHNFSFQSKLGCKDLKSIQSSTTPDQGYQRESDKLTVGHHKRESRGQPFPSR